MGYDGGVMALWCLLVIIFIVRTSGECISSPIIDKNTCKGIAEAKFEDSIVFTSEPSITEASGGEIYGECISSSIIDKNSCKGIAEAKFEGSIVFTSGPSITEASGDFGGIVKRRPAAVLSPASVEDISKLIKIANASPNLTIAARGNGHSVAGQALVLNGIVVNMTSFKGIQVFNNGDNQSYVNVKGGEFWVDVLRTTQPLGLSPRSWTDYLDLSIGGTLSNAGISGQTHRYGPQISNVLQLEVVTGNGDVINCSSEIRSDLFFGTLGGLGQFGIITGADIVLQKAYERASQWRFVYWNFTDFMNDQELLISLPYEEAFDYVEGFIVVNDKDGWTSIPFSQNDMFNSSLIPSTSGVMLYIIEATLYYDLGINRNQIVEVICSKLGFIKGLQFTLDSSYFDFLYRVHSEEEIDRANGIWFASHAWLNVFIPKYAMLEFNHAVFNDILKNGINRLTICYPMHKSLWNFSTSVVLPEDGNDIFYVISLLYFNKPYPEGPATSTLLAQNKKILDYCKGLGIPIKQYLGIQETQAHWVQHFGEKWNHFSHRKKMFDPKHILAPGQKIFSRIN